MSKTRDLLSKTWLENIKDLDSKALNELVVVAELRMRQIAAERDNDEKLAAAEEIAGDLKKGYKALTDLEKARITYLLEHIEELGELDIMGD